MKFYNLWKAFRAALPIAEKKPEIVNSIVNSKVTIIIGETGSGKTTQVPQFILEDAEERLRPTRIYFSQPPKNAYSRAHTSDLHRFLTILILSIDLFTHNISKNHKISLF